MKMELNILVSFIGIGNKDMEKWYMLMETPLLANGTEIIDMDKEVLNVRMYKATTVIREFGLKTILKSNKVMNIAEKLIFWLKWNKRIYFGCIEEMNFSSVEDFLNVYFVN